MRELPKEWRTVQHNDIAEINPGLTSDGHSDNLTVSFLPMKAVQEVTGKFDLSQVKKVSEVKKGYTPVVDGDLIFAKITPCMENGKIAIMAGLKNGIGFGSTEFHVSRPRSGIQAKYLFYYFVQSRFREDARRQMTGSAGQLRVPTEYFRRYELPLAATREQEEVIAKIEELFSDLDNAIQNLKLAQEQLKVYRQAILNDAFTGKLTKKWRDKLKSRSAGFTTRSPQSGLLKNFTEFTKHELEKFPKLPSGWFWVKSGNIIHTINNGYTPKAGFMSQRSGEVPFIKVYNLNFDGSFNFEKNPTFIPKDIHRSDLKRSVTFPGDVLINIVGPPLGKVSIIPDTFPEWNINQAIVLFRPNRRMKSKFISYYLQSVFAINWLKATSKATAGQYNIKVSTCRLIPFPLVPEDEQEEMIKDIENRLSICDKLNQTVEEAINNAETLRQSILGQAFDGKLTKGWRNEHKDLISGDNSAEALVKKIMAEKVALNGKVKRIKNYD